jgi:hypothetical protein
MMTDFLDVACLRLATLLDTGLNLDFILGYPPMQCVMMVVVEKCIDFERKWIVEGY